MIVRASWLSGKDREDGFEERQEARNFMPQKNFVTREDKRKITKTSGRDAKSSRYICAVSSKAVLVFGPAQIGTGTVSTVLAGLHFNTAVHCAIIDTVVIAQC